MRSKNISYSLALLLCMGAFGLSGCGGGGDGDSARVAQTVDASKNGVIAIALEDTETDGYVHIKGNLQFNLIGTDDAGKEVNLNDKATWTLSDKSLGTVKNGLFTASGKLGENLNLTVSYAGLPQIDQPITLTNANLTAIVVTHVTNSVDVCKNTQFTAKASFSDGKNYDYPLTWALVGDTNTTLANFADETKPELSTKKSGIITVIARGKDNDDKVITSNELPFTISNTLTKLTLASNKSTEMNQGQTATVTVTADYQNGSNAVITPNASLESSNTNALTVNTTSGLITAVTGTFRGTEVDLSATCDTTTEILKLTIVKPDIRTMEIVGPNSTIATESLSVSIDDEINPRIKITYADASITPEIYTGTDVEWIIDEEISPDYDKSKITIDGASGLIEVADSLALTQDLILTVQARIKKLNNDTEVGSDGNELEDTIAVTIRAF